MNAEDKNVQVVINTDFGDVEIRLYNSTPLHRDNFIKLVEGGFYDDQIFHRVIKDFMIQGGDPESTKHTKDAYPDDLEYSLPAEIDYPRFYHKRGVLAAARLGDNVSPHKESSSTQFYIVTGTVFSDAELNLMEKHRFEKLKKDIFTELNSTCKNTIKELYRSGEKEKLTELRNSLIIEAENLALARRQEAMFTDEQREVYKTTGGTPHLDGEYTVFGEVVKGMEVIDKIQQVKTNEGDRPLTDVKFNVYFLNKH